jgi:hypothetical protein
MNTNKSQIPIAASIFSMQIEKRVYRSTTILVVPKTPYQVFLEQWAKIYTTLPPKDAWKNLPDEYKLCYMYYATQFNLAYLC